MDKTSLSAFPIRTGLMTTLAVVLTACVSAGDSHLKPLASGEVATGVAEQTASMVVIRESDALPGQAVNIFVNGEYLTSLQPGAFRQGPACVGENRLMASYTDVSTGYQEKVAPGQAVRLPAAEVSYFRVVADAQGQPVLQALDAESGLALAQQQQEQVHTLRRVELQCAVPLKTYTLQASALFPFDKFDYASMLAQGKTEIRQVAADIAASQARIDRIEVIGHTDPEGSDAYNQQLSERRASTVRQALAENRLPTGALVASGRGERELLVSDCRARFPRDARQRTECDQPNRRVEIKLFGQAPDAR
ncbi:MAG: OmpA family protein [Ramlibacter sp.]|nr:OmpA family protein [Ramlibacter sp.]